MRLAHERTLATPVRHRAAKVFPRFAEENRRANEALVDLIRRYADDQGATPAQVALASIEIVGERYSPPMQQLIDR